MATPSQVQAMLEVQDRLYTLIETRLRAQGYTPLYIYAIRYDASNDTLDLRTIEAHGPRQLRMDNASVNLSGDIYQNTDIKSAKSTRESPLTPTPKIT
jgi:hypothetical protein